MKRSYGYGTHYTFSYVSKRTGKRSEPTFKSEKEAKERRAQLVASEWARNISPVKKL